MTASSCLQPARWEERVFHEMRQQFRWASEDGAGDAVALTLPWAGVNEDAIEFLEAVHPARDELTGVVVRLAFGGPGVLLEPLSLLSRGGPNGHRVLNPAFDRGLILLRESNLLEKLRQKYGRDRIPTVLTADEEGDEEVLESGAVEGGPAGRPDAVGRGGAPAAANRRGRNRASGRVLAAKVSSPLGA